MKRYILQGFTLVETMITLLIMSLLVAMMVFSWNKTTANATVRDLADEISMSLEEARTNAMNRNAQVAFNLTGTGTTWTVTTGGTTLTSRTSHSNESSIAVNPNTATITFNGQGRLIAGSAAQTIQLSVTGYTCIGAGGDMRCLNVMVDTGGRVKVCDPSMAAGSDPRAC